MTESDKRTLGRKKFKEVMGFEAPEMEDLFLDFTLDHLFPNVWAREGLSLRERRLITLTILTCLGNEATLGIHMNAALQSGDLDDQAIDELMLHLAHYAGWPVAATGTQVARKLRSQREKK